MSHMIALSTLRLYYESNPLIWEEAGMGNQLSYFQFLNQGARLIACDLIGFCQPLSPLGNHQDLLIANLFGQATSLTFGTTAEHLSMDFCMADDSPFQIAYANRQTKLTRADSLTPRTLGSLIVLPTYSMVTRCTNWNIDSFSQWGIQVRTLLATRIISELASESLPALILDSSLNARIRRYRHALSRSNP
ncbi:MAG TPA: hypothetical protein PK677_17570 [Acidiphilium sp.]|nr:hypothetical protein [Acidiphilium sp.]